MFRFPISYQNMSKKDAFIKENLQLNLDEIKYLYTLEIRDMLVTYPDSYEKKYRIAARVVKKKDTDIKINVNNGKTKIDVRVPFDLEILAIPSLVNYAEDIKNDKSLNRILRKI